MKHLKYLLLFGSGSYDPRNRVSNNYRFIPTYQSNQSLDPLSSFTSDDFFGMLDDGDDAILFWRAKSETRIVSLLPK